MMAINKQAAIKTAKIILVFTFLVLLFSIIVANTTIEVLLGAFFVLVLSILIRLIYQICLNEIEWEQKTREREQIWQKLDEERKNKIK